MKLNIKKVIKESIADYLAELNTQNEEIQNEAALEEGASEFEDKVTKDGNIYLVLKADKNMAEGGIVREVSLKSLIDNYRKDVAGVYLAGPQALTAGKKLLKARDAKLKENIEVGKSKVTELEAKIEELKRQIEDNSTRAVHDPQRRGELTETNDGLFSQLEKIEGAVEKLKTALEKESPKKAKKGEINETSYKTSANSKEAQHLKKGDIVTGGEIISVSSGARTPSGKVEVILKGKDGKTRKHIWGKFTKVGVKSKKGDEGELNEGFNLKQVLRKIGWVGESWTPQEFASQIKKLDDATLIAWSKDFKGVPNTPLAFQQKLVKIELKKRGLEDE